MPSPVLSVGVTAEQWAGANDPFAAIPGLVTAVLPARAKAAGKLYQNSGKTTPAASDGDPVRVATSPYPDATDWPAPTDAAAPLLYALGGGKWGLLFDGADDRLSGGNLSALFTGGAGTVGVRFRVDSVAVNFEYASTGNADTYALFTSDGRSYPGQLRAARLQSRPGIGLGWHTLVVRSDGTRWTRWLDGMTDITAGPTDSTAGGFAAGTDWRLGCAVDVNHADTRFLPGVAAGMVAYSSYLTDAQTASLAAALTALGGP